MSTTTPTTSTSQTAAYKSALDTALEKLRAEGRNLSEDGRHGFIDAVQVREIVYDISFATLEALPVSLVALLPAPGASIMGKTEFNKLVSHLHATRCGL